MGENVHGQMQPSIEGWKSDHLIEIWLDGRMDERVDIWMSNFRQRDEWRPGWKGGWMDALMERNLGGRLDRLVYVFYWLWTVNKTSQLKSYQKLSCNYRKIWFCLKETSHSLILDHNSTVTAHCLESVHWCRNTDRKQNTTTIIFVYKYEYPFPSGILLVKYWSVFSVQNRTNPNNLSRLSDQYRCDGSTVSVSRSIPYLRL